MKTIIGLIVALSIISCTLYTQTQQNHVDWFQRYTSGEPIRQDDVNNIAPDNPTLQYNWIGYNYGRYMMLGWLQMYEVTRDQVYLNRFTELADRMFIQSTYFRDVGLCAQSAVNDPNGANGHQDGYLGWGNRERLYTKKALSIPVTQHTQYHCRMRIEDVTVNGLVRHQIRFWVNGTLEYEEEYDPFRTTDFSPIGVFSNGTIALLSGWSETRFWNVVVRQNTGSGWTTFYNLNNSLQTFPTDWQRVAVSGQPSYTAEWSLNDNHEIYCNAADDSPPGYPTGSDFLGRGKYAALVLVRSGSTNLLNTEIEFDMMIDKRNWTLAESGVSLRYSVPSGGIADGTLSVTVPRDEHVAPPESERSSFIAPGEGDNGDLISTYQFVKTSARYV